SRKAKLTQSLRRQPNPSVPGQLERRSRYRGHICKAPVFDLRRGKPHLAKTGKGILAQLAQPGQVMANRGPSKAAEALEVISQLLLSRPNHNRFPLRLRGRSSARLGFHRYITF